MELDPELQRFNPDDQDFDTENPWCGGTLRQTGLE